MNTFHQQFNDSQFSEIYVDTNPGFKSVATEAGFLKFMTTVRQKLGAYQSGKQKNWEVFKDVKKTEVVLTYDSTFEKGKGMETFVIIIAGGSPALQGYHIDSNDLLNN